MAQVRRDNEKALRVQERADDPAPIEPGYYLQEWRRQQEELNKDTKFIDFQDLLNPDFFEEVFYRALTMWAIRLTHEFSYIKNRKLKTHRNDQRLKIKEMYLE